MSRARRSRSAISYSDVNQVLHISNEMQRTISISLFSRKTPYSNLYVSTPLENKGNLMRCNIGLNKPIGHKNGSVLTSVAQPLQIFRRE